MYLVTILSHVIGLLVSESSTRRLVVALLTVCCLTSGYGCQKQRRLLLRQCGQRSHGGTQFPGRQEDRLRKLWRAQTRFVIGTLTCFLAIGWLVELFVDHLLTIFWLPYVLFGSLMGHAFAAGTNTYRVLLYLGKIFSRTF